MANKYKHRVRGVLTGTWDGLANATTYPISTDTQTQVIAKTGGSLGSTAHALSVIGRPAFSATGNIWCRGGLLWYGALIAAWWATEAAAGAATVLIAPMPVVAANATNFNVIAPPSNFTGTVRGTQRSAPYEVEIYYTPTQAAGLSDV